MPPRNRRSFLGVAGAALVGVAGCLGDTPAGTTDEPSTEPSTTTARTTTATTSSSPTAASVRVLGDVRVAVVDATVRKAVAYESIMGSGGVLARDDRQFVVAAVQSQTGSTVDATGDPPYDAFELVVDGETYPAVEIEDRTRGAYTTSLAEQASIRYDAPYADGRTTGWVAFEPPSPLDATDAAVRCRYDGETVTWPLASDQTATLGRQAPVFEPRSFEATVHDAGVDLSLVAENVSETEGRFLAAVYWPTARIADDDESTVVEDSVAAGGRIEWTGSFDAEYAAGEDGTVTASVDGAVSAETTVDVGVRTTTD
ncbi:hypothetical protein [Halomicrococcus sp. SG-WS-1]|uniref:hypothetical protein n=1 Tax=Halomicrococcus sp. SG-WS-1 TaxID=3439057 RepID=UPI003F7ACC9A